MTKYSLRLALILSLIIGLFFAYDYKQFSLSSSIDLNQLKKDLVQISPILSIEFNPKNSQEVVLSSEDGHVYLWRFDNDKVTPFVGHSKKVYDVKISPDNLLIASSGYDDKTVRIWDIQTKKELQLLSFDEKPAKIAFSPDSHYLAIGFYIEPTSTSKQNFLLTIYDIINKKEIQRLIHHQGIISSLTFSGDGQWLVSGASSQTLDNTIDLLEWRTGEVIHRLSSTKLVTAVAISSDNQKVATGKQDGELTTWDIATGNESMLFKYQFWIPSLRFTHDGRYLLSASHANKIILHDLMDKTIKLELNNLAAISGADLSPDDRFIGVSVLDGSAKIYDLQGNLQHILIIGKKAGQWIACNYTTNNCIKHIPIITWELIGHYKTLTLFVIALFGFLVAFLRLRFFKHPVVVQLSQYPETLLNLPLQQLNETKKLLQVTRRLEMVLGANQIAVHTFKTAAKFSQLKPLQRAEQLANRLSARIIAHDSDFYFIKLPKLFPLNIEECYLYFPNEKDITVDIIEKLTLFPEFQKCKIIVITTNVEQQQGLLRYAQDIHNEIVVPDAYCLARWLLSPEATQTVSKLMASQLNLSYLSPYYNRGSGVDKDTAFFGRTHIISQITGRNLQNYIIVGGRRIGKTSLLKFLHRHYKEQPTLNVYYFDATDSDLQRLLIDQLQLTENSTFDDVVRYLRDKKETYLFLIDEADVFIKQDEQHGYDNLKKLRAVSAEGHCYFILAGFWHLYQATVFEYHSPLRNFGEIFELSILELDACRKLVTRPLAFMNITITDELVERMIQQLGQRADLISQICHLLVTRMDITTRTVTELMVEETFQHQNILYALYGWQTLAPTEAEQALDCMIMSVMVTEECFSLRQVFARLTEKEGYSYSQELIKKSLQRLVLCCVLKVNGGHYAYTIPLLKEQLIFENMDTCY